MFWGDLDPVFLPAGGDAYKRDARDVKVKHINGGHFMLETHLVRVIVYAFKLFAKAYELEIVGRNRSEYGGVPERAFT